jgi:hypothetical protein
MVRTLALIFLPLALLAAACSSGGDGDGASRAPDNEATPSTWDDTTDDVDTGAGGSVLLNTLNPLELLGSATSGRPSFGAVDPDLSGPLLTADDLPSDYLSLGDFTFSMPSEYGDLEMAASMFSTSGPSSDEFGPIVMSAVVAVPPAALEEFGDLDQLGEATQADLDELRDVFDELGGAVTDLRLLDASDLGDGGMGMHLVLDLGAFLGAFGAPEEGNPFEGGIAMEMYMFVRGDRMLMTMVMWPADMSSGVDGRDLAEVMDARAS